MIISFSYISLRAVAVAKITKSSKKLVTCIDEASLNRT